MHRNSTRGDQLQREKKEEGVNQSAVIDKKAVESLCLKGYRGLTVCILWSNLRWLRKYEKAYRRLVECMM